MRAERRAGRRDALLLVLVACLAYLNGFTAVPQFDDHAAVLGDPACLSLAGWWQAMPGIRPLLKLSFALNGGVVVLMRVANVALHALNTLLAHHLARRLLPAAETRATLVAALVFAVHPANTEAVMLLAARSVLLMIFFLLLGVLAFLRGQVAWSLLACVLAVAARETALAFPLLLTLLARSRADTSWRDALRATRWHWLLAALLPLALLAVPRYRELLAFSLAWRDPLANLVSQAGGWTWLLRQWWWPVALNADPALPVFTGWRVGWIAQLIAWGLLAGLSLRGIARGSLAALALAWFLAVLLPGHSLIARVDIANERDLYAAGLLFSLLPARAWLRCRARWPRGADAFAVMLCATLLAGTIARNAVYASETAYWSDVARKSPHNARAWNNLGYAIETEQPSRRADAVAAYDRALALDRTHYRAYFNRRRVCALPGPPVPGCASPGISR